MNSHRFILPVAVLALSALAFGQSDAPKAPAPSDPHGHNSIAASAPKSEAQVSFETIKSLAGVWTAKITVDPPMPGMDDKPSQVSMRVTSRGNALVHEMYELGVPDDPTRYDHPVTMLYLDGDHLNLVHYCDAGNRPHMVARPSADGKTVEFDFVDISGRAEVRTHAPRGVHRDRREPSHRGLDLHDAGGQADARALRPAAETVKE